MDLTATKAATLFSNNCTYSHIYLDITLISDYSFKKYNLEYDDQELIWFRYSFEAKINLDNQKHNTY